MPTDAFAVVADPTRRRILHELIECELSVGELVWVLDVSQPTVSKHLRVLRDNGFVASRTVAQRRLYRLDQTPFVELETWLSAFQRQWNRHVDALERHLDAVQGSVDTLVDDAKTSKIAVSKAKSSVRPKVTGLSRSTGRSGAAGESGAADRPTGAGRSKGSRRPKATGRPNVADQTELE